MRQDTDLTYTVLHVCWGNICRSPMAERLLTLRWNEALAGAGLTANSPIILRSISCGTGSHEVGEDMHRDARYHLGLRGADTAEHCAQTLSHQLIATADLILTAELEHSKVVEHMDAQARPKTFVLGEFARLYEELVEAIRPEKLSDRYQAPITAISAIDKLRSAARASRADELPDPWGYGETHFGQVTDRIDSYVRVVAELFYKLSFKH